jgi:hypothetical protein
VVESGWFFTHMKFLHLLGSAGAQGLWSFVCYILILTVCSHFGLNDTLS